MIDRRSDLRADSVFARAAMMWRVRSSSSALTRHTNVRFTWRLLNCRFLKQLRDIRLLYPPYIGLSFVLFVSSSNSFAQCNRGGGGMPSGSTSALNSNIAYSSNPLASNYPQSSQLMASRYQQRALQIQNLAMALAYQNSQRQRIEMLTRNQQNRTNRLARAEATRAARAERIARLAERYENSKSNFNDVYMFTSTKASH